MTVQAYLQIENNVVTNNVMWDGDTTNWQPPSDATMVITATTPALVWQPVYVDGNITDYVLTEVMGAGAIGFTWNGTACVTNEPKPAIPVQPTTQGTQTL